MPALHSARYGKDNVRVLKVEKDASTGVQTVTEMTVTILLEGEIEASYADFSTLPNRPKLRQG